MTAEVVSSCAVMCGLFLEYYGRSQLRGHLETEGEYMKGVWE